MINVCFLLLPNYIALDFVGPAEAFRMAAQEGAPFRLRMAGPVPDCPNSLGMVSRIDPLPDDLGPDALLIVCGTLEVADLRTGAAQTAMAWMTRLARDGARIATVCSGALLAGMAGLLDGRACTTHHAHVDELRRMAPLARVLENRIFVEDGPVCTSAGISTGIDLALALIERHAGPDVAARVARRMVLYVRRAGDDPQRSPWLAFRNHLHPAVHRAQDAIAKAPDRHWSVSDLARTAHVSGRHLTRLFREEAGIGIVEYQQRLRIALARILLSQGMSVERAADGAGFGSARALRRVWMKFEVGTPSDRLAR
ncbi:GlxA family transcriptional regulator [Paludibacterium paludis]|uniref:Transcriptional regulator n=1 Tax=Paludibacterium paludis TaxID=1225769 RepID=A0A918U795_9NEIS|nr:helix-turn-helix domain-containing protein [Paludibacterium paludis]GGY03521.1 transcriptional regulator [Paludibacterium paludis]